MSIARRRSRTLSKPSRTVRTATAAGAVSLGLLALSACEKPTPVTTFTIGSDSVTSEAACYEDGETVLTLTKSKRSQQEFQKCLDKGGETLTATAGQRISLGVEPDMAETGWLAFADGQPLGSPTDKTYRTFPAEELLQESDPSSGQTMPKDKTRISVVETEGTSIKGVWNVTVKNGDA